MERNQRLSRMVLIAILGAWAIVLRMLNFSIFPPAPFLKFDFSDLMALIGLMVGGPGAAAAVALIREVINYISKGGIAGVPLGQLISFICNVMIVLPFYILLKTKQYQSRKKLIGAGLLSVFLLTLVASILNYYVAVPMYIKLLNFPIDDIGKYVLSFITPFNLIKGSILVIFIILAWDKIIHLIQKRNLMHADYL